jgi:hypothetical protein
MNLDLALSIMRTGEGRLRPIIDYYAKTKKEYDLIPYLYDNEIRSSILYILSELPTLDSLVLIEIKKLNSIGLISDSDKAWTNDIILNHS